MNYFNPTIDRDPTGKSYGLSVRCVKNEIVQPVSLVLTSINTSFIDGNDGSVDLSVTGGLPPYTYHWSNGNTEEDIHDL